MRYYKLTRTVFEPHGHENGEENTGTPTGLLCLPVQKGGKRGGSSGGEVEG